METLCRSFQRKTILERRPSLGGSSAKSHTDLSRLGKGGCSLLLKEEKNFRRTCLIQSLYCKWLGKTRYHAGFTWAAGINSFWEVFGNVLKRKPDCGAVITYSELLCVVQLKPKPSLWKQNYHICKNSTSHYREKTKVFALLGLYISGPYHLKGSLSLEEKTPSGWLFNLTLPSSTVSFERLDAITILSKGIERFSTCLVYTVHSDTTTNTASLCCFCSKLHFKYSGFSIRRWTVIFLGIGEW